MHGLMGGSWKRSGHRATAPGKNDLTGNHEAISGPETYRRLRPPRQLSTLLRNGNSGRKLNAVDGYVHERLAIFASRKHRLRGRNWTTRFTYGWITRLGVYRLTGNVHRATAHASR